MWEIPYIQPLDHLATMAPSHLLGRPVCSEHLFLSCSVETFHKTVTNFKQPCPQRTFCTALLSPGAVPASPLRSLLSHTDRVQIFHTIFHNAPFIYVSNWFIFYNLHVAHSWRYLSLAELRLYFPSDSVHLFLQRFRDSTANVLESSFQNTQSMFIPSHQWHTWKSRQWKLSSSSSSS